MAGFGTQITGFKSDLGDFTWSPNPQYNWSPQDTEIMMWPERSASFMNYRQSDNVDSQSQVQFNDLVNRALHGNLSTSRGGTQEWRPTRQQMDPSGYKTLDQEMPGFRPDMPWMPDELKPTDRLQGR